LLLEDNDPGLITALQLPLRPAKRGDAQAA
jgi:hypothetical protein